VEAAMLDLLAQTMDLGSLLAEIKQRYGAYDLLDHWTQGEFHHDVVLSLPEQALRELPGQVLVVATNCNGGVKELLSFGRVPDRWALWHHRCPSVADFAGELVPILARSVTEHRAEDVEDCPQPVRHSLRGTTPDVTADAAYTEIRTPSYPLSLMPEGA
jgi:hypothetical protein